MVLDLVSLCQVFFFLMHLKFDRLVKTGDQKLENKIRERRKAVDGIRSCIFMSVFFLMHLKFDYQSCFYFAAIQTITVETGRRE